MSNKKLRGQFFTISNPFNNDLFYKWTESIDGFDGLRLLEPFAGSNNIVKMIADLGFKNYWSCFDIEESSNNNFLDFSVEKRDSLSNYPKGFDVAITNPPYLAKNSASRTGLPFPNTKYDDLYKYALDIMLKNNLYIAAIIPESFVTQELFHERLLGIVSLTCKMFDDTDCPVCLSLFVPETRKIFFNLGKDDFFVYKENVHIGNYIDIKSKKFTAKLDEDEFSRSNTFWKFNAPDGEIGLYAIDNTKTKSIRFVLGNQIDSSRIKVSSRGVTRIKGLPDGININKFIKEANKTIEIFRENTCDLFLTAFKGLRKDGFYRRRLDFNLSREILSYTLAQMRAD